MTDLVATDYAGLLSLAEQISRSPLMPAAYRGKPADAAIAMLYGGECGLPPMTSLQRIVVVNGRPGLDAQGMVALIRSAGHSITGEMSDTAAVVTGKRKDTGDEMIVSFTIEDAARAGLVSTSNNYAKFPADMLWSKAVSRLGRRLFADVLMGMSYTPDEIESFDGTSSSVMDAKTGVSAIRNSPEELPPASNGREMSQEATGEAEGAMALEGGRSTTLRPPPNVDVTSPELIHLEEVDSDTGEIIDLEPLPVDDEADTQMKKLSEIIDSVTPLSEQRNLRANLLGRFGSAKNMSPDRLQEAIDYAKEFAPAVESPLPVYPDGPF